MRARTIARRLAATLVLGLFFTFGLNVTHPKTAQAYIEENKTGIPAYLGHNVPDHQEYKECNYGGGRVFGHALIQWLTEAGQPTSSDGIVNLFEGQDSKNIQVNIAGHHCTSNMKRSNNAPFGNNSTDWSNALLRDQRIQLSTATVLEITTSDPPGTDLSVDVVDVGPLSTLRNIDFQGTYLGGGNARMYTSRVSIPFTLKGLNALPGGEHKVYITAKVRWVNQYSDIGSVCVSPPPPPNWFTTDGQRGSTTDHNAPCESIDVPLQLTIIKKGEGGPITGKVYNFDDDKPYANVEIDNCIDGDPVVRTNSQGRFSFDAPFQKGFCVRVKGSNPPGTKGKPKVLPTGDSSKPGRGYLSCQVNSDAPCSQESYEWQVSQADCYHNTQFCGAGKIGNNNNVIDHDRNTDQGYDLVYSSEDVCPNIAGIQTSIPNNMVKDDDGNCVSDVCPNIPGIQATVPVGMVKDSNGNCVTPPEGCPSLPNPHISITMPGNYYDYYPYSNYYGSWGSTVTTRHTQSTTYVSHRDASNGGSPVTLPLEQNNSPGNPGSVVLNYTPYIDNYPFDQNVPQVTYNERYNEVYWSATGSPHYYPIYDYVWHTDTDPYTKGNQGGYVYEWTGQWGIDGYYYQTSGYSELTTQRTVDGQTMYPCWDRRYDVNSVNMGAASLTPDREDANNSSISATVNVQFDVNPAGAGRGQSNMRVGSQVGGIPYTVSYRVLPYSGGVGASGTVTSGNLSFSGGTSRRSTASATASGSVAVAVEKLPVNLKVGDRVCWIVRITGNKQGSITPVSYWLYPYTPWQPYAASGTLTSTEQCSEPVVNWPYVKVFGNDVVSGGRFGSCGGGSGTITGFKRSGNHTGSSTQYAAFALGVVGGNTNQGFTSAALRNGAGVPAPPTGLTFANTGGGDGGGYSAADGMTCLPDYFASKAAQDAKANHQISVGAIPGTVTTKNADSGGDPKEVQYFYVDGPATLNMGGAVIPGGTRKVIFVNGPLTITNNIATTDSWNGRSEVPYVMFVARGIEINSNVSRLDGVYVSQNGAIQTCTARAFFGCQAPLVVNGALIAEQIQFQRTRGSLRDAVVNEGAASVARCSTYSGTATADGTPGGLSCAGEVINYSPELFLALTQLITPQDTFKLDSYVTLPPNL